MFADLHLHSTFSDGTDPPESVIRRARVASVCAVALTDHDTTEGCASAAAACTAAGIEFLPGAELTAEHGEIELHILAYCVDADRPEWRAALEQFQVARQQRIREMIARLNHLQIPLQTEAVLALPNCRAPGRPHVARALVQGGFCISTDEAFERFLKRNRPAWVPKFKIAAARAIALIHRAGGVAVLAHPGLNATDEYIPDLVRLGLDGIECYHTKHSATDTRRYLAVATELGVLISGGSDCHGPTHGGPLLGSIKLAYEHVERIKARAAARRRRVVECIGPVTDPAVAVPAGRHGSP